MKNDLRSKSKLKKPPLIQRIVKPPNTAPTADTRFLRFTLHNKGLAPHRQLTTTHTQMHRAQLVLISVVVGLSLATAVVHASHASVLQVALAVDDSDNNSPSSGAAAAPPTAGQQAPTAASSAPPTAGSQQPAGQAPQPALAAANASATPPPPALPPDDATIDRLFNVPALAAKIVAARADAEPAPDVVPALGPLEIWARGRRWRKFDAQHTAAILGHLTDQEVSELRSLCGRCLYHTLSHDLAVHGNAKEHVFVATGDIDAQWLRDSAVQLAIYLPRITAHPIIRPVSSQSVT